MYVIAGLGNPGKKYDLTRHNVGFEAVDLLAQRHGIKINKIKYKAVIGEGTIAGEKVMLVKPQTFMNLSGESIFRILNYYQIPIEHLIVMYDDIDTPHGRIRIRKKGSAGTHNGMRHIIYMIQNENFPRVRIGIGNSGNRALKDYVLQRFTADEQPAIMDAIERAASAAEMIIERGTDAAMNAFNGVSGTAE